MKDKQSMKIRIFSEEVVCVYLSSRDIENIIASLKSKNKKRNADLITYLSYKLKYFSEPYV